MAVGLEVVGLVVVGRGGGRRRRHVDPPLLPLPDGAVEDGGRRAVPGGGSAQSRPGSFHFLFSVRPRTLGNDTKREKISAVRAVLQQQRRIGSDKQ